jgi:hypothetical protein
MTNSEFEQEIKRLEVSFGKLDADQGKVYYDHISGYSKGLFSEAIDILIDVHPAKRFPLVAEIHKAVEIALSRRPKVERKEIDFCARCLNEGMFIVEDGLAGKSRYCNCRFGRKAWEDHKAQTPGTRGPLFSKRKPRRKDMDYPGYYS